MASQPAQPGPYWVRTATNGKHQVCGRHGATIREYMPDQIAMATADCRKLQAGHAKAEAALFNAAPDLLKAAKMLASLYHGTKAGRSFPTQEQCDFAIAAIAKAEVQS